MTTAYHSQFWAHALTLPGSGGDIAALSRSIANARIDLNPHQIDATLFALRSPFTNGAILADKQWQQELSEKFFILLRPGLQNNPAVRKTMAYRRNIKRRELFDAQDAIDQQQEELIGKIEKQLKHTSTVQTLYTIRWRFQ